MDALLMDSCPAPLRTDISGVRVRGCPFRRSGAIAWDIYTLVA